MARQILGCFGMVKSGSTEDFYDIVGLTGANFQHRHPVQGQEIRQNRCQMAIARQPVGTAIQGETRLEARYFGLQLIDLIPPHIGRVSKDQIEGAIQASPPIGLNEMCPPGEIEPFGVCPRNGQGRP